ncbi:MAG: putative maltokinase [Magnetococcales bacterium]|nr:putative maltokinase [Magnetococcales bacterium]
MALFERNHAEPILDMLTPYLADKRWFAAKGHHIERIDILEQGEWHTETGHWLLTLIEVHCTDIPPQTYFLPLAICREDNAGEDKLKSLESWSLAWVREEERSGLLYEAFGDDQFCRTLVRSMGQNVNLPFGEGQIEFRASHLFGELADCVEEPVHHPALEMSHTAVCFGNRLFLKGYRRLQAGTNPEVEAGRFLTERSPCSPVVPVVGTAEFRRADGQTLTLALLQAYVENQGIGWNFVVDHLERFLTEQLAEPAPHAVESPDSFHGFLLSLMDILGRRTAELHQAFGHSVGEVAFEPEPITPEDLVTWSTRLHADAVGILDILKNQGNDLPVELRSAMDHLLTLRPILLDHISRLATMDIVAAKMRYHGDYHLGQVLLVKNDFIITDFEGEPLRSMEERRQKHSPLRDVAGMLRSFSYAATVATNRVTTERPADRRRLGPMVQAWEQEATEVFLKGYRAAIQGCPGWPVDPNAAEQLIQFFIIEKALYELRYEMANRPDWLSIPLFSLIRKLEQQ